MSKTTSQPFVGPAGKAASASGRRDAPSDRIRRLARSVWKHRWLYALMTPSLIYFVVFRYIPLWNAQIAFKDFKPVVGVLGSPWVGLKHFYAFVNSFYFAQLIGNTLFFSLGKLLLGIPMAIILAVALYETSLPFFRKLVQTASYLPHFLSWVIVFGVLLAMLSPGDGLVNEMIKWFGGQPISFLTSSAWFRVVVIGSEIWKETGWGTILFLAALLSIEPALFEAAEMDGASRFQRIWHISLPGILDVIVIVTLLRLGTILDAGFNQIFVLYSLPVYSVGDIIDTWVYRQGILEARFSLATAVGLFKGVIGLVMIVTANRLAKRVAGSGLY
jgi:putative aldouronate transport system permease protein